MDTFRPRRLGAGSTFALDEPTNDRTRLWCHWDGGRVVHVAGEPWVLVLK